MWDLLKEILVTDLNVASADITPETPRRATELDSLAFIELSGILNKKHGIVISEDEIAAAVSLGDISSLMEQRSTCR